MTLVSPNHLHGIDECNLMDLSHQMVCKVLCQFIRLLLNVNLNETFQVYMFNVGPNLQYLDCDLLTPLGTAA